MSTPDAKLTVEAADETAEILVLDTSYAAVRRALGRLEATLPQGLYKLRVQVGPATEERLLELADTVDLQIGPLPFATAVPLSRTASPNDVDGAVAAQRSRDRQDRLGDGASVFVFSREPERGVDGSNHNPASGLSLHAPDGQLLANIEARAVVTEGIASWCADVAPGAYRLRLNRRDGSAMERALIVAAGQQMQVFLWTLEQRLADASTQRLANLANASLCISLSQGFEPEDDDLRVAELVAYALVQRREALSAKLLGRLGMYSINPLLGLLGAHLMLHDQKEPSREFDALLDRLSTLFSPSHPDICALRLKQASTAGRNAAIRLPPLLRESWEFAVEASVTRPDVIALDPPWRSVAQSMISTGPWLSWRDGAAALAPDELSEVQSHAVGDYLHARAQLNSQIAGRQANFLSKLRGAAASVRAFLPEALGGKPLPPPELLHPLDANEKIDLARSFGVPGDVLDAIITRRQR